MISSQTKAVRLGLALLGTGMMLAAAPAAAAQAAAPFGQTSGDQLSHNLRLLAQNPKSLTALMGAGKAALDLGDAQAALTFFARAEESAPRDGRIKMYIGSALVQLEKPDAAMKFFQEASSLGVSEADLAGDRGLAFDLAGDPRRAQRDYRLALAKARNPEITRRLALSLAISGEREPALQLLADQLLVRDPAGQRTRAFVLALTGDALAATRAAEGAMPVQQAAAMAPFLARLPVLAPRDRALAVHFGHFPEHARNLPVPPAQTYASATVPARTPAATGTRRTYTAVPTRTPAAPAAKRAERQPAATAAAAPKPRSSSKSSSPDRYNAWSWSRGLTPRTPAPNPAPQQTARAPAAAPPQPVQAARSEPVQSAPAPQQQPVQMAQAAVPQQQPVQMAQTAPRTPAPQQQPPVQIAEAAAARTSTAPVAGATAPAPAVPGLPFDTSLLAASQPAPAAKQASLAAVQPAPTQESGSALAPTTSTAPAIAQSAPVQGPVLRGEGGLQPQPAPAQQALATATLPASVVRQTELAASSVADQPPPAAAPVPRRIADLAAALADIPEVEPEAPSPKPAAKKPASSDSAAKKPVPATAAAKKAAVPAKKAAPPAPKEPARVWVQVAGGANKTGLPREFARLKSKAPEALAARAAWTTPLNATNRLLVGPFVSTKEAQAFINELAKEDLTAFAWTSEAGQKIEKLPAK